MAITDYEKYNHLTIKELEVVTLLCENGWSRQEIAKHLFLTYHTVNCHLTNVMNKLDLHTIARLMHWYYNKYYIKKEFPELKQ